VAERCSLPTLYPPTTMLKSVKDEFNNGYCPLRIVIQLTPLSTDFCMERDGKEPELSAYTAYSQPLKAE